MTILRILVVEDDVLIGALLAEMLIAMGHAVCAVATTEAGAVAAAAEHRPGLVIADARLGAGSGLRAVAEITRAGPVPHVFMSGDLSKIRASHPDATMLRKPFGEPELRRAIQRALA